MQIGMVGLGRMGSNMAIRLMRAGHEVVGFDTDGQAVARLQEEGALGASSLVALVAKMQPPRAVWVMVPAGEPTERTISSLGDLLERDDLIVDGGNSRYTDSLARADALAEKGIGFVDVGTSGGIWGLESGYCLMVGGDEGHVERIRPLLESLGAKNGYARVGPTGAGHFTKMVHNGIEYALMQSYGEGFELLHASELDIDTAAVAELWRYGSVIRSWLLDLAAKALEEDPDLSKLRGYVEDSGEGRWTVETAVQHGVPANLMAASLFARFASRQEDSFANRLIAALRREFGGHEVREP